LRRQRWKLLRLTMAGAALVMAAGTLGRVDRHVLASGYVTTEDYAEVRPAIQGMVAKILVHTDQEVRAGDILVQLDDSEEQALWAEAVSRARKVEAELSRREAQIAEEKQQRKNEMVMAKLRLHHASARLELTRELSEKGLASARALEDEELKEKLARVNLEGLRARDETLFEKELAVLRQELAACRNTVTRTEVRVRARQIRAPISGNAIRYGFVAGELVRPDTVLYEIFGNKRAILKLRVAERYATLIAPGQPYRAQLRPYKGLRRVWFTGKVEELRDVIEAENQRTYRIAICSFDGKGLEVPPGTTAEARIRVGRSAFWMNLFQLY